MNMAGKKTTQAEVAVLLLGGSPRERRDAERERRREDLRADDAVMAAENEFTGLWELKES